ncbi:MAG: excinuclease ABC subunit UvrC [Alphaproteobacteria bacterium]|nr:excinuclease ABC subunit UvrC [Alphaproteobacteria bacterium]
MERPTLNSLQSGVAAIEAALKTMSERPGVYRMSAANGDLLYVGKAKNLKKRVASYTQTERQSTRIARMIAQVATVEIAVTHTEVEALLLEANLIRTLKPRYNVLLRDDKSFPYILIEGETEWPRIGKYRGARNRPGEYFGPFASATAVNRTLYALQRAFPLRSCSDSVFANRTRPCLQFQIKRCSAPCVGRIGHDGYDAIVAEVRAFLSGKSRQIQDHVAHRMDEASAALDYETAAVYRDRLRAMAHVQGHQGINPPSVEEADVIAVHQAGGQSCIQTVFIRAGQNLGNRAYFPSQAKDVESAEVLSAFLGQFYDTKPPPALILLSESIAEQTVLAEALAVKRGRRVEIAVPKRGVRSELVAHALTNARDALGRRLAESQTQRVLLDGVAAALDLEEPPARIEVYDNSHVQGAHPMGCMIVAGPEGFVKSGYRKFGLGEENIAPGDDYGMMRAVLTRRFGRLLKEDAAREKGLWPDLVLIDGGAGQLSSAQATLAELGIEDVELAAIAKGPDRNAGRERIFRPGREQPIALEGRDPVLYYLQRLRDEAHRFAVGAHRRRRQNALSGSELDAVPGIGAKRKRALIRHFGSAKAVAQAAIVDLERVEGVSRRMAETVYRHFHADEPA